MRRRILIISVSVVAAVFVSGFTAWWFLLRSDAPPPVSLEGAVAAVTSTTVPSTTEADVPTSELPPTTTTSAIPATGLNGTWAVDDSGASFVGYRVEEELANFGFTEAVGRTTAVTGSLELTGALVTAVEVDADLTMLRSDRSNRDSQMRRQGIETDRFPTATFSLTDPIDLGAVPSAGVAIQAEATGDLTIHGVTQRVTLNVEAQVVDDVIVVIGSLPVVFADYGIARPRAAIVLSVEDNGIMELQLAFRRP